MTDAYKAVLMATQWPGMEIGKDTDADRVRDLFDGGPRDPADRTLVIPKGFQPLGGAYDTDGDLVADANDTAPLDPDTSGGAPASTPSEDTPGAGAGLTLVAGLVAVLAVLARRRPQA